ncbi:MAG: cytochrome c biogenesis protein CcdA, partial [Cetobacterium sp.]
FTFCFAWTPSLAPTLSTILNLIVTLEQNILGHYTIIVYSLGFIIPLMILGMSSTIFLNIFKSKQTFLKYSVKISGAFLILIGVLTLTGYTSELSKYFIS